MRRSVFAIILLLVLVLPSRVDAAITVLSWTNAGSTTGDNVTTPTMITSNATLLVACVSSTQVAGTMSDSESNTWTALTAREANGVKSRIYYVANPATDGSHTFTYSTTGGLPALQVLALSGTTLTSVSDGETGATATGTSIQPGSVTPSVNNALVVSCLSGEAAATSGISAGYSYPGANQHQVSFVSAQHVLSAQAYLIQTTAAAANPTWSWAGSIDAATSLAVFKAETGIAQGWPPPSGSVLPTTCVEGQTFFQTTTTGTTLWTCATVGNRWNQVRGGNPKTLNATDFGAICDGVADDTVALQKAFDAADVSPVSKVYLPAGTCLYSAPLIVGNDFPYYSHISIEGTGIDTTTLQHFGANTEAAFQIRHNSYFEMSGFTIFRHPGHGRGTTIGVLLDRATWDSSSNGTQVTTGTFRHFVVSGFAIGMTMSQNAASSEIACWHCGFADNTTGWTAGPNLNALNYWFFFLGLGGNDCGMFLYSEAPHIWGGHSANNRKDFCFNGPFGNLTIENFRAESCSQATDKFIDGTVTRLVLRTSIITNSAACDPIITLGGEELVIEDSHIAGKIALTATGSIMMRGNTGIIAAADGRPFSQTGSRGLRVDLRGNRNSTGAPFKDEEGLWTYGETMSPWITQLNRETDPPTGGIVLHSLRSLGYGSSTIGRNLRDQATFATSGTVAYTFKKTVTVTTTNGSNDITFAAGVVTASDVGKQIAIPNMLTGDCYDSQTDITYYGRIAQLLSSTSARLIPAQWTPAWVTRCRASYLTLTGAQANTVIGEDEPDVNYFPVGLFCNTPGETIGWSAIAATGFTLTSPNPSSTNVCNFTIQR